MAIETNGQKVGRINVKKLKGDPKELTVREQKKVKGGLVTREPTSPKGLMGGGGTANHNETLSRDSTS